VSTISQSVTWWSFVRLSIANARRLNIPSLICFSGNRNGLNDDAGAEITAEGFARVAREAEIAGIDLALELLNSKVDHPDYQADHTAWGLHEDQELYYPAILRTIKETSHVGYITHQFIPKGDPVMALKSAFQECAKHL
jgi:hydroxypyruvate isomerase